MHFSLIVLEAADDWNDDSASVDFFTDFRNITLPRILNASLKLHVSQA
jgi:hypothetical protein